MRVLSEIGTKRGLAITLGVAFLLRIAAAVVVQHWVNSQPGQICLFAGDAEGYWELARHITQGGEYAAHDPPRRILRMPGFPLILAAGMRVFGEQVFAIRLLLAAIGTLTCGLVYWLGSELFDATTGGVAAILAAISPILVVFSVLLLSETSFAAALVGSLIAFARLWKSGATVEQPAGKTAAARAGVSTSRGTTAYFLGGVLTGVAALIHPTWLLAGPIFVAFDLWRFRLRRDVVVRGAVLLCGLTASLLPWIVRNGFASNGHFVPTTLWVGASLYDGLNPAATGASDMRFIEVDGLYAGMRDRNDEYAIDQHYRREAWKFVKTHPAQTVWLALVKVRRFWSPWPNSAAWQSWPVGLALAAFFAPMMVLAAVGGWTWRHEPRAWLVAAGPILYLSAVHAVFVGSVRYRIPGEYALPVLTAAGVRWCWKRGGGAAAIIHTA